MSYSDFNIKQVQQAFDLTIVEKLGLFSLVEPAGVSDYFVATLEENIPLVVAINTEKAKSKLLISNVLIEIRKQFARNISFFPESNSTSTKTKD